MFEKEKEKKTKGLKIEALLHTPNPEFPGSELGRDNFMGKWK